MTSIEISFIHGFCLGIEVLDAQDEESYNIIALHIGFIRVCFVW
jgi:hypothetical protein